MEATWDKDIYVFVCAALGEHAGTAWGWGWGVGGGVLPLQIKRLAYRIALFTTL